VVCPRIVELVLLASILKGLMEESVEETLPLFNDHMIGLESDLLTVV